MTDTNGSSATPKGRGKIILVIDEGRGLGEFVFSALKTEGPYQPLLARDGSQALELITTVVPDLFVFHEDLPDIDGFELAERIWAREALQQIPILLMRMDNFKISSEQGHLVPLEIPFELEEFFQIVQSLVAG